ncbi:hypothetical protein NDU88_002319 [Pleurodeles waltl]|uniref:Uncharacterized protein n=1 Tax=Pleurodeles waltl TaxID=8319 RepID=A0AAV7KUF1_PLEWA|nr:hypothetical protein NDU88_002319 [Pleurodeles waltl]
MLLWPRRDQDVANCVRRQRGRPARQRAHSEASSTHRSAGTGTTKWSEPELTRSHKEGPTSPEDNSGGRALQVRMPGPRLGCAQRKSWKSAQEPEQLQNTRFPAMQSSVGRQGLISTKLGLKSHWTVGVTWTELLSSRDLARRAERRPRGPVMQFFGACGCRGKIPSTHGRFLRSF